MPRRLKGHYLVTTRPQETKTSAPRRPSRNEALCGQASHLSFLLRASVRRHRRAHDFPCDDGKEPESSIDFGNGQQCSISGAVNQTYGFFTRGPVIGDAISLRASALINQMRVFFARISNLSASPLTCRAACRQWGLYVQYFCPIGSSGRRAAELLSE